MLRKFAIAVMAVFFLACVGDLFAQEGTFGPGPKRKGLQRRGRAAKELRKYEGEMREEKQGLKRDRAERFEGWGKRGPWRDEYGKKGLRRGWQKSKFGQGWGRRGGGRGMKGWCPRGQRGGRGWQGGRGGRGMRRSRGRGDRSFGPDMGMRGRGPGFGHSGMQRRKGHGFSRPGMGRGGGRGLGVGGMRGRGMQKGHGARGMRGLGMRSQGGGFGHGRRGPAKRQRRSPSENDFDWDW